MVTKRIIAGNINNLTDARYFAAQGASYLLFDLGVTSVGEIAEIVGWVSGPETMLILSSDQIDDLDEAIIKLSPTAIGMDDGDNTPLEYLLGHIDLIQYNTTTDQLTIIHEDQKYTTDTDAALEDDDLGLLLLGGDEEKVGYKSYDDLDEVFDRLYEM